MVYMEQMDFKNYLNDLTGIPNLTSGFKDVKVGQVELPKLILNRYDLKYVEILDKEFILAQTKNADVEAKKLIKHEELIRKAFKKPVIFFFNDLGHYQSKHLTSHKINFVVNQGDVFLPDVLLVLKEYKKDVNREIVKLTNWAMMVLVYQLNYKTLQNKKITDLALIFKFTKMQASRIVDELKAAKLVEINQKGTYKYIQFLETQGLWNSLRPFFQNPVIKKIYTDDNLAMGKIAGYTALDRYSMLHDGGIKTKAIYKKKFAEVTKGKEIKTVPNEFAKYCFEIWNWDPELLAKKDMVDPVSLYLSMRDYTDDRTQIALDELLKEIEVK
jgi:hypothetical protein